MSFYAYLTATSYLQGSYLDIRVATDMAPGSNIVAKYWRLSATGWVEVVDIHSAPITDTATITSAQNQPLPRDAAEMGCPGWPAVPKFHRLLVAGTFTSALHAVTLHPEGLETTVLDRMEFTVRSASPGTVKILYLWPFSTALAYSQFPDGRSLYENSGSDFVYRARQVSLDKPLRSRDGDLFSFDPDTAPEAADGACASARLYKFLESMGHHGDSCSSFDLEDPVGLGLNNYNLLVSMGHDEYWSQGMRDAVESFIASGGNVAFFSANTMWWKVAMRASLDGRPNRVMVCAKDSIEDPQTTLWSASLGSPPENTTMGLSYKLGSSGSSGAYTAQNDTDWVFNSPNATNIQDGDGFGSGGIASGVGSECDGAELMLDGVVKPTGRDGTPPGFRVLAYCDERGGGDHAGWGAVMGYYVRQVGGVYPIVFHSGCNGWSQAVDDDPILQKITLNVASKLENKQSQPAATPSVGVAPTASSLSWTALDEIAGDHGIVANATGLAGSIFGHLFLASGGRLYRRAPYKEVAPAGFEPSAWEDIDALPAGTVGIAGFGRSGRPVLAYTSPGAFYRDGVLPNSPGYSRFGTAVSTGFGSMVSFPLPADTKAVAASDDPGLSYALTYAGNPVPAGSERLHMGGGALTPVGRAPGIRAITTHQGKLIGLHANGSVLFRESQIELDLRWMPLAGPPPAAAFYPTTAVAACLGRLYVIAGSSIYSRACTIGSPYRPGKVILYDKSTGAGSVELVMPTGQVRPLTSPPFSSGWTHVVEADPEWNVPVGNASLVFYNASNGYIATCTLAADGTIATLLTGNVGGGWQVVRRIAPGTFLFYKSTSASAGAGQVWQMNASGAFSNPPGWGSVITSFGKWTDCVASSEGGLLFVDSRTTTNNAYACRWTGTNFVADSPGTGFVTLDPSMSSNPQGKLMLAPVGNGILCLYRRRSAPGSFDGGPIQLVHVDRLGAFQSLNTGTLSRDWSHMVGTSSGLLLFYAAADSLRPASGADVPAGTMVTAGIRLSDPATFVSLTTYETRSDYTMVGVT